MSTVAKVGNVSKIEELQHSKVKGTPFIRFDMACTPYTKQGEPKAETTYYKVTAFGSLAENIADTVHKGQRVVVLGEGSLDTWTGKDGKERTTKVITAEAVGPDLRFVIASLVKPEPAGSAYDTGPF